MIVTVHEKGGGASTPPPPPPSPADAAQRVDRTLVEGRKRRLGYQATILGGGTTGNKSILGE